MALLVSLLAVMAVLQYRWIGEISEAERARLQVNLRTTLANISRDFDSQLIIAMAALAPTAEEVDDLGREQAYQTRYATWKSSGGRAGLFHGIALTWMDRDQPELRILSLETSTFRKAEWTGEWSGMRDWMISRRNPGPRGGPGGPFGPGRGFPSESLRIERPRFVQRPDGPPGEQEWLVLDVDAEYLAKTVFPELLARHLGSDYASQYQVEVAFRANPDHVIFSEPANRIPRQADASVGLFDEAGPAMGVRGAAFRGKAGRKGPPRGQGEFGPGREGQGDFGTFSPFGRGRLLLSIRMAEGSLDAVVSQARRRNLGISALILILLLVTVLALAQASRRSQRLAQLEMEFVAGVSHELRTPLTVIRTAAYNLRGKMAANPIQVERYGALIQDESEKLTAIVEQVLRFSGARVGRIIREREPLGVKGWLEGSLKAAKAPVEESKCRVEVEADATLPVILGDAMALQHALQNLIANAAKYGRAGGWIGLSAKVVPGATSERIEVRVSDRGPGIPAEEQKHVFDPFFRGKRALRDQIHGTGLGLNLVKKIVEAHEGTVEVESKPGEGTTFIIRIPIAPAEYQDEFANSLG